MRNFCNIIIKEQINEKQKEKDDFISSKVISKTIGSNC